MLLYKVNCARQLLKPVRTNYHLTLFYPLYKDNLEFIFDFYQNLFIKMVIPAGQRNPSVHTSQDFLKMVIPTGQRNPSVHTSQEIPADTESTPPICRECRAPGMY